MSRPDNSNRPDPGREIPTAPRPKIWVAGRQRPRFDARAFVATSFGMARRDLEPAMLDTALRLDYLGQQVLRGERKVNFAWAGRSARIIPSHQRVGGWILALSTLFRDARSLLLPPAAPPEALAYPDLARRTGRPEPDLPVVAPGGPACAVSARRVQPGRPETEPTLHAIRSAISDAPHDAGLDAPGRSRPPRIPLTMVAARNFAAAPAPPRRLNRLARAVACRITLAVLLVFAIPAGAVKALLFHLDGGDPADWS